MKATEEFNHDFRPNSRSKQEEEAVQEPAKARKPRKAAEKDEEIIDLSEE